MQLASTAALLSRRKGSVLPLRRFRILRTRGSTLSACPVRSIWSQHYATVGWWTGYVSLLQKRDGRHRFVQEHFCWPRQAYYTGVAPRLTGPHALYLESVIPRSRLNQMLSSCVTIQFGRPQESALASTFLWRWCKTTAATMSPCRLPGSWSCI